VTTLLPPSQRALPSEGPARATARDIPALNELFSEAFSDRYRRDGMHGVRVPPLNPPVWRYAIEDAAEGALLWRDAQRQIIAFNMVHRSGTEGWMGPLCVRPAYQGAGLGRRIVQEGIRWLQAQGATVIGLETMPRTVDNIGFYSRLGFVPGPLTITLTLDAALTDEQPVLYSRLSGLERDQLLPACRALTSALLPGTDYTREIELTHALTLGDTVVLGTVARPIGYAVCHTASLVEGRSRDELRVLKLVVPDRAEMPRMLDTLCTVARESGVSRLAVRLQMDYGDVYRLLIARGAQVRWTDLRMSLTGYEERVPPLGVVLSNWEI
jgi:GNAT superfamily N-acetyltransferase